MHFLVPRILTAFVRVSFYTRVIISAMQTVALLCSVRSGDANRAAVIFWKIVIDNKKSICPLCSEVTISVYDRVLSPVCCSVMSQMTDGLLVTLPDHPGGLAEFSQQVAQKGINIKTLRVITKEGNEAVALFSVDRPEEALTIPGVKKAEGLPIPFQRSPCSSRE